jgi:hypothetical protein
MINEAMFEPAHPLPSKDVLAMEKEVQKCPIYRNRKLQLIRVTKDAISHAKVSLAPIPKSNATNTKSDIKYGKNYDDRKIGYLIYQCYRPTTFKEMKEFIHFKLKYTKTPANSHTNNSLSLE